MKKFIFTSILALLITGAGATRTQDRPDEYLGLPGDNLNLYAVMKLFQESETVEAFERNLNDENSRINNLDLNRDNMVDYITVSDYVDGNIHTIVLRTALSRNESQDVAVFTVEKLRNGEVRIQLIGDEALYGQNYIIEPNYAETPNPGYAGNRSNVTVVRTTYYDVAAWPVIRFIFYPGYMAWHSSWYWGYYPVYWNPWRPWYWHYYYGYHSHWYPHYYSHYYHHHQYHHHAHYHNHYYSQIRHHSPVVHQGIREGRYSATYSRPDQRREGEALYARTSGTREPRPVATQRTSTTQRSAAPSVNREAARPSTTQRSTVPATNREAARPSTTQRSTVPATNREAARPSTTPRTTNTQRSTATPVNRSSVSAPSTRTATTTQRSATAPANRSYSTSPSTRPATTTQRSSAPSVNREASRPASTQKSATTRSSSPAVSQRPASRSSASVQRSAPAKSSGSSAQRSVSRSSSSSGRSAAPAARSSASRSASSGSSNRR